MEKSQSILRKRCFFYLVLLIFLGVSCEKTQWEDEDNTTVNTETGPRGGGGGNGNTGNGNTGNGSTDDGNSGADTGDDDGDDEGTVDSSYDDRETPYEETDFVDGNDPTPAENDDPGAVVVDGTTYHSVAYFQSSVSGRQMWVTGYIVAACSSNYKYAEMQPPFSRSSAILIADKKNEKNIEKMISIQLKQGKIRTMFNLVDNPGNYNRRAAFFGSKNTYLGITGMKDDIGSYLWLE